ncbi:ArsR family transcriptional regulator [Cellulomonas sp. Leaf334]|uniref:ArsR family transcriptional regulator n=1 Tax=Cellulomonas sp. Leaf334 TaxID=1736339 RepID=UPI0012E208F3|nr:ArsR family transcriptional regulator [Cellulomonas sp. Leaf334]
MRTPAPALLPILRSQLQGLVLYEVLTKDIGWTAAELARALAEPEATVHRETRRLLETGLLTATRLGRAVVLRGNDANPVLEPLRQLLIISFGPRRELRLALSGVARIDRAYIFGSWAARFVGLPGPAPADIDLLVVGDPDRGAVDSALDGLEAKLRREINVTFISADAWEQASDPFVRGVRDHALVPLDVVDDGI